MLLIISIISLIVLFLADVVFARKNLYEKTYWLDRVMHFLGGFFVGMFWLELTKLSLLAISLTLLVGVIWEMGEYFLGIRKFKKSGTRKYMIKTKDTIEDLIFDILGAIVWILIIFHCCFFFVGLK